MSSIVSAITGGGSGGDWKAQSANLLNPSTVDQANQTYGQSQMGLEQQSNFLGALQAQNGLGNQSSVFNQMQGVANGTGPNPAQAMLNNATGANVANQAAMMAGQRGSNANVGMMARQAGQQGANIQQQAAGQGAAMQAQQSLGALNQMGGIAGQQVNNLGNATNAYSQSAQNLNGQTLSGIQGQNQAAVGNVSQQNNANAHIQAGNQSAQQHIISGLMGGAGTALGMFYGGPAGAVIGGKLGAGLATPGSQGADNSSSSALGVNTTFAKGGPVKMADGGAAEPSIWDNIKSSMDDPKPSGGNAHPLDPVKVKGFTSQFAQGGNIGPQSSVGRHFHGMSQNQLPAHMPMMAQGGAVPALVSPGEKYLNPTAVEKVKQGADPLKAGETIPGKAKVKGAKNSYANDTVPKTLEEGGIVLPRSVTQSKHPEWAAHKFVAATLREQALKKR